MDQLACMRSFVRVADLHSFTQAADALGLSRAVVSTHVAELERHLRCQLLHRTTLRVGLTADGSEYLARCQRILAELVEAGYVKVERVGRRNRYTVDREHSMRHSAQLGHEIGTLLEAIGSDASAPRR